MTRHRRPPWVAAVLVALSAMLGSFADAAPAAADAPRPTDYRSTVTDVSPTPAEGIDVRVVGGDSLLELTVPRGHTALVADYPTSDDAEPVPYLRFDADGTVRRNALAVATTANQARYGASTDVPDPEAAPRWETVATDGTYAWHDHRIHWMSPSTPKAVDAEGRVDLGGDDGAWTVPLTIDGTPTVVTGQLVIEPAPATAAWVVLAGMALAVTVLVGLRWGLRGASVPGALSALAALVAAVATHAAIPADVGASAIPVVVAVVALVAAVAGALGPSKTRLVAVAAAAAALLGWGLTRWTVLARAVLPTTLAPSLDRAATAAAIGVGLALAAMLVVQPGGRPVGEPAPTASPSA